MLISIHALRKESDPAALKALGAHVLFQSTLSVRRATGQANTNAMTNLFQSTLSVRRATIASEAPLFTTIFQSTLSVRRATSESNGEQPSSDNFNPRSP